MANLTTKNLLLDLDGTLLGSRPHLHLSFITRTLVYLAKQGVGPIKAMRALHELRMGVENHEPGIKNAKRAARRFGKVLGIDAVAAERVAIEMLQDIFPALSGCFFPMKGACEFIGWAKDRYPLILATNPVWPREFVEQRVKWAGLDPKIFSFITDNNEMHHCKPSTKYYEELVEKLKINPAEALMIGDSARKDLPAKHVGIPVFLLAKNDTAIRLEEKVWKGNFAALKKLLENVQ